VAGNLLADGGRMAGGPYAARGYCLVICMATDGMGGPLWAEGGEWGWS